MATMPDADRIIAWERWMRDNADLIAEGIDKNDLKAGIDAADLWISNNQASYNSALPSALQSGLTPAQKARILGYALIRRFETGVYA
jgi:hypothetical protein